MKYEHIEDEIKWPPFCSWFLFHWISFAGVQGARNSIGSNIGLASNRRQVITWSHCDIVFRCMYVSPSHKAINDLLKFPNMHWIIKKIIISVCHIDIKQHQLVITTEVALHYDDVIMSEIASQITSLTIVYSIAHSGADQSKHQSSASLAFVWEIHRGPVNFPHKWPVTRKMFPFDDVIMDWYFIMTNLCLASWGSQNRKK